MHAQKRDAATPPEKKRVVTIRVVCCTQAIGVSSWITCFALVQAICAEATAITATTPIEFGRASLFVWEATLYLCGSNCYNWYNSYQVERLV